MKPDFTEPDDIYDEEISLGTKPGVPAEYETRCVHETQLQAKDASLQEALEEISKLKSRNNSLETAMMETRKNAYEAEEKARIKGQKLTIAKKAIIDNNAQINNLERRNTELNVMLSDTADKSDKMHEELVYWKTKYANDYKDAVRLGNIYGKLGADLFYQMTQLEVIIANACGIFFFREQDVELKDRACTNLTLDLAYTTKQCELFELSRELNANNDLSGEKWTAIGQLRLAIEAPPMNNETGESSRVATSEMELAHVMGQETRVVDDLEHFEPTTSEKSTSETNLRSDSEETSLSSPIEESNGDAGRPDSATSNELEQGSSMCDDSSVGPIVVPEAEDSSNDEGEKMRSLLGYNPNPEEPFYPQYEKASNLHVLNESVEETFDLQQHQSPSGVMESPLTCYESATGPNVTWILGFNPKPEEPFYPQYSPRNENEGDSTSPASIQQDQEQTNTTVEPIIDIKLEMQTTATTMADSERLVVDVSFADTSKEFTASNDSSELEQQVTPSKTPGTTPIFSQETSPTTTAPTSRSTSINISFSNTSQPFKAGTKPRMTRAQRREAAMMKAQAEAMAAKKEADDRKEKDEGEKKSRQERRAAERKALKAALKQPRRNIVRF